ncbi:hypothetical protein MAQ5080_00548 [Marinomonas aquimarina]|uniref:Uncharacterized protein n=1 Tax=Marinomonas aquimarina TaxID=295068 RepID=A0A1A8T3U7_9GAMM|nr:hypothetical protein [Marinomonas aquimarina]SBS26544.1 hypothetical protein MAQ5080_00548 [Marinomonas aquimarina]
MSALLSAGTYVFHDGRETVSRVLSMSLSASTSYQVPVLNNPSTQLADGDLVITVGLHSYAQICASTAQVAIIALFLGEEEFALAQSQCSKSSTAVLSGAPLDQRLNVLQSFWEDHAPIAVVHSDALSLSDRSLRMTKLYEVEVYSYPVVAEERAEKLKALTEVLENSNLVMSLYDSALFDTQFSKDAIRLMFHKKKALAAHSLQLVRAGALFALYSTSQDKLSLVSSYIKVYEASGTLMPPSYPNPLRIAFNPYLIRLYGLVLPTDRYLFSEFGLCPESGCEEALN